MRPCLKCGPAYQKARLAYVRKLAASQSRQGKAAARKVRR